MLEPGLGYIRFPESEDIDQVFLDQLTAETLQTVNRKGRVQRVRKLIPGRRSEALDLTILSMAALNFLGPKMIKELGTYAEILSKTTAPDRSVQMQPRPRSRRMISQAIDF